MDNLRTGARRRNCPTAGLARSENDLAALGDAFLDAANVVKRQARPRTAATATAIVEWPYATFRRICPFLLAIFRDVAQKDAKHAKAAPAIASLRSDG